MLSKIAREIMPAMDYYFGFPALAHTLMRIEAVIEYTKAND